MADPQQSPRPAWQTNELEDEWPEEDVGQDDDGSCSLSLTEPLESHIKTINDEDRQYQPTPSQRIGTFLVRTDVSAQPLWPKTPRWNGSGVKDFFSPLALERMFEPPQSVQRPESTAALPASPKGVDPTSNISGLASAEDGEENPFGGGQGSSQFTFSAPRITPPSINRLGFESFPQAQSTPGHPTNRAPSSVPSTDPRLRLFRFQYDTFTREHLSAVVDSIAVNTPSISSGSSSRPQCDLRSRKRIKLSPSSECNRADDSWTNVMTPRSREGDIERSRSLVGGVKRAADNSTLSTLTSGRRPGAPAHGCDDGDGNIFPSDDRRSALGLSLGLSQNSMHGPDESQASPTSMNYAQQAAELMAQIKQNLHSDVRIFSGDTEVSPFSNEGKLFASSTPADATPIHPPEPKNGINSLPSKGQTTERTPRWKTPLPTPIPTAGEIFMSTTIAAHEINDKLAQNLSNIAIHRQYPPVQVYSVAVPHISIPPSSHGASTNESATHPSSGTLRPTHQTGGLDRIVSSSTASGTTLTAGSVPPYVNSGEPAQIRRITPEDVPSLPERVGRMVFNKELMKWVKATAQATTAGMSGAQRPEQSAGAEGSAESEDPFKDIESLHSSKGKRRADLNDHPDDPAVPEGNDGNGEEDMELASFAFSGLPAAAGEIADEPRGGPSRVQGQGQAANDKGSDEKFRGHNPATISLAINSTPRKSTRHAATPIRSALKSANATPTSALKRQQQTPPKRRVPRRSVSFSDGRKEGPIRGIGRNASAEDLSSRDGDSFVPSARSKRIAGMMEDLEDSDSDEIDSPLKTSSSRTTNEEIQPLTFRRQNKRSSEISDDSMPSVRQSTSRSQVRRSFTPAHVNATFLTECSFGVAHDRLVEVITDVEPFEPHWEDIMCINLSEKNIDSVARLKEFIPRLDELNLNSNQIAWLSGVPSTVRTLSVASNKLTGITSFGHLLRLQHLDISNNEIESLRQLDCLRHLQELCVDGNAVNNLEGLENMKDLMKLSVEANRLQELDFGKFHWPKLQVLNLCKNDLDSISRLEMLTSLISVNLDNNCLESVQATVSMPRLRILRVSGNKLQRLDLAAFPNLRTMYADDNMLASLAGAGRLTKIDNVSLRNQSGRGINLSSRDVRDVKRLYLSGNALKNGFLAESCYNLVYMELAACRLTSLPSNLAQLVPNLRTLNLNYNFLDDVGSLKGLKRLAKVMIIGSRLRSTKPLIRVLQGLPDMEILDLRMNPCTLGWYMPLLLKESSGSAQHDGGGKLRDWQELDTKYRRDLPDEAYLGRLAYRGLVMRACPKMKTLDGVDVTEKERAKAMHALAEIARVRA